MVSGTGPTSKESNPTRVADDSQVEKTEIKKFKVDAGEILIQVRDDAGDFVPLPPA
jgi:hypothetical protein